MRTLNAPHKGMKWHGAMENNGQLPLHPLTEKRYLLFMQYSKTRQSLTAMLEA